MTLQRFLHWALALLLFSLLALGFTPARPRTDSTRRENIIKRALERKHWPRTPHAVRLSLIVGKYIAEKRYHWREGQWRALRALWSHESGWQWWVAYGGEDIRTTDNACGIPQRNPCPRDHGYRTNPVVQIRNGLGYIDEVHGSPIGACGSDGCSSGTYRVEAA